MKKLKFWSVLMLMVMALSTMVACGDDDNDSKKVDGVNVITRKKIVELSLTGVPTYYGGGWNGSITYKIEYDSEGRLMKIVCKNIDYTGNNTSNYTEIASIDYELRILSYKKRSGSTQMLNFSLNNEGYIDQIGPCSLTYDQNGYLVGVEDLYGFSTLVYKSDDFIKSSVSPLLKGKTRLYYVSYGNAVDKGDLYIRGHYTSDPKSYLSYDHRSITCFIAYQAGLFGKISKTIMNLKNEQQASAILGYEDDYNTGDVKISFVWQ